MASVAYNYECDKSSGFIMDPNAHRRVGYVTSFSFGQGPNLQDDLVVTIPFNGTTKPHFPGFQYLATGPSTAAKVLGVMENFSWAGGVGDPIEIDFYVSQSNATQIKALQQTALKSTAIKSLGWWVGAFDQETKMWFEQSFPKNGSVSGVIVGKDNPELDVDLNPVSVKDGIDVMVYKVHVSVAPGANMQYALAFANSSTMNTTKNWGLVIGSLAATALS